MQPDLAPLVADPRYYSIGRTMVHCLFACALLAVAMSPLWIAYACGLATRSVVRAIWHGVTKWLEPALEDELGRRQDHT